MTVPKTLFVDRNSSSGYTPDGSIDHPFTTIMAAVAQVIANGDNSASAPYLIDIIGAGTYTELVDIGNAAIRNLTFDGHDAVTIAAPSGGNCFQSLANNDGQARMYFTGLLFSGTVQVTNGTANGNLGIYQWLWHNCQFVNSTCLSLSNTNYMTFYTCSFQGDVSVTNTSQVYMQGSAGFNFGFTNGLTVVTNLSLPMPSGLIKSGTYVNLKNTLMPVPIAVDAGSELDAADGSDLGLAGGDAEISGTLHLTVSSIASNVTVAAGGKFVSESSSRSGSLALAVGANYVPVGNFAALSLQVGSQQQILGGTGSPEGVVSASIGSVYLRADGGVSTTMYVKENGGSGNTGWDAK